MNIITNLKSKRRLSIILLLFLSMSTIFTIFPMNSMNSEASNEDFTNNTETDLNTPSLSTIGAAQWWNSSFNYRQLINITNPHSEAFTDFIANVTFNYTMLVNDGHLNQSLKDIRIVENGTLRDYYIAMDYPKKDFATVWFETDISAGPDHSEIDTYMYYGNENASFASSYLMNKNPDGLIWYKFEEIIDGKVIDSMGNYNATVKGNPQLVSGGQQAVGGYSLEFNQNDGTNDYLAIENKYYQGHNQIPELTVCVWYRTSETTGSWTNNWAFFDFDRSEYFNFFIRPDNGKLGFSSASAPTYNSYNDQLSNTQNLNDGSWHFGSARYDGTDKYIYIDSGQEDDIEYNPHNGNDIGVGDDADFGGSESNDDPRYGFIGDGSEATTEDGSRNNLYYHGFLDEIRYFEEALSPERIGWIAKNYQLETERKAEESKEATVRVYVKDVDGRVVSGAEVFLFNETQKINYTETTGELGYADFLSIDTLYYNITVNYTIYNGADYFEEVVFNSSILHKYYRFDDVKLYKAYIEATLWSIDFEIEDRDADPMGYGYVLIYNKSDYSELIANLTLNKEFGTQTFRWINTSQDAAYYYEVYYDNEDYSQQHTLVNRSLVNRPAYLSKKVVTIPTILVNQTNIWESPGKYLVQEKVYASGSNETHIGNTKIINTTITLNKMEDNMDTLNIYSIDAYNNVSINPIYTEVYLTETSDIIELNITELVDAYGLLIDILGTNTTDICNGTIDVSYTETYNQYVKVNMSKLEIKVYDTDGIWKSEWGSVRVNIFNGTPSSGDRITTLLTNDQGIAKGQINSNLDFWYITNTIYTFTLEYGGDWRLFNVSSDQHNFAPNTWWDEINYTLYNASIIEFRIKTSIADFAAKFQEEGFNSIGEWEQNFAFRVRFLSTDTYTGAQDWDPITNPDFVDWEITDLIGDNVYDSGEMNSEGDGYYNYTINSGFLIGGEQYYFKVYGEKTGYQNPAPIQLLFTVSPKTTTIGVYNTSDLTSLGGNVTQYYGEQLNLTVLYSSDSIDLEEAIVSYEWQFTDSPMTIAESPAGKYSFVINTIIADVGTYQVRINAAKENYSSFQNYRFDVTIINRPTALNGDESLHLISKSIWVREAYNFIFEYEDIFAEPHVKLTDLDQAYYQWYEISNGSIVGAISDAIDLVEDSNSTYILDFSTASRDVGDYALFVTVQKNNYDVRTALIDLTIKKRIISWDLTATNLVQSKIKVDQGKNIIINITLTDTAEAAGQQAITDATVLLRLGSNEYELVEGADGTYTYTFKTGSIDTFFAAKVLTGDFTITKEDYISISIPITIVVDITEIFPGVPMFYFLMIVGAIVAVVGSLVTYRVVQQRRIPTFVKKARAMKKDIKGKKSISDSLLYPSKEAYIGKKFGDKWAKLGLSLEEILGIKGKVKKEKLSMDKLDDKKFEKEKLKKDKLEKKKLEREKQEQEKLEKTKLKRERLEKERLEKEKVEKDKLEKKKLEREKQEQEKLKKEKLKKERLEKDKLEKEKLEKDKLEKEKLEKEKLEDKELPKERGEEE